MNNKILLITPGPKMSIDKYYFEELSRYFSGAVLTTSNEESVLGANEVAGFRFYCQRFYNSKKLLTNIKFILYCLSFAIKERLKNSKYHLVVTYDPLKSGVIGMIVSKILGAKFAPEVNGVYTSDAEYLDEEGGLKVKIKKTIIKNIMSIVLRQADGIKLLFDTQIDPFKKQTKSAYIERFPCYVATADFKDLGEEKVILFAGFPFKRKAVDVLIAAFKKIADKYPEWKLKILGWFPDPTELNNAIGGHSQIFHHPPVYYKDMPGHIGKCAFLVLPSRSEAMGRVLVEAMAAGKPRIGSNVDGIPTVINDNEDGLLVEPENIDDLAEKMELLISQPKLRKKLGNAAANRAKTEFAKDVYFKNTINFYKKLM